MLCQLKSWGKVVVLVQADEHLLEFLVLGELQINGQCPEYRM